jgi:hypothetical protein
MDEVLTLLKVVHYTRELPKLKTIHDDAMAQLEAIANEPKKDDWEKKALDEAPIRRVAEA